MPKTITKGDTTYVLQPNGLYLPKPDPELVPVHQLRYDRSNRLIVTSTTWKTR